MKYISKVIDNIGGNNNNQDNNIKTRKEDLDYIVPQNKKKTDQDYPIDAEKSSWEFLEKIIIKVLNFPKNIQDEILVLGRQMLKCMMIYNHEIFNANKPKGVARAKNQDPEIKK
jgi:hypothetical protein